MSRERMGTVAAAVAVAVAGLSGWAAAGPPMPAFKVETWVTEKTLDPASLKGKPYVVEFWATWCGPCRVTIPHLNEISRAYETLGMVIIGLTSENQTETEKIRAFAREARMNYFVGMNRDLQKAMEVRGIPHAVVVDHDGTVAWQGHPMRPDFEKAMEAALLNWLFKPKELPHLRDQAIAAAKDDSGVSLTEFLKSLNDPQREAEANRALPVMRRLAEARAIAAESLAEEDPVRAAEGLDKVGTQFQRLEEGKAARVKADGLRKAPGFAEEKAVSDGMGNIRRSLEEKAKGLANVRQAKARMTAMLPLLKETHQALEALIAQHPNAKLAAKARAERDQIKQAIQAYERGAAAADGPAKPKAEAEQ